MTQEEYRERKHNDQVDAMVSNTGRVADKLGYLYEIVGNANVMWFVALIVFFIMGCVFLWHVDYIGDQLNYIDVKLDSGMRSSSWYACQDLWISRELSSRRARRS